MTSFTEELYGLKLETETGSLGALKDFRVSTADWYVRQIVWNSSEWLSSVSGMLSIETFEDFSPDADGIRIKLCGHGRIPSSGGAIWAGMGYQTGATVTAFRSKPRTDDMAVRSIRSLRGCRVVASDGALGVLTGFMINFPTWKVDEIVVRTGPWYAGKQILVSPDAVKILEGKRSRLEVALCKEELLRSWEKAEEMGIV